jgi:hypothetical protein
LTLESARAVLQQENHIIEISWSRALKKSPSLLGQEFVERIGKNPRLLRQRIRVRVKDRTSGGIVKYCLVLGDIEQNPRGSWNSQRARVGDSALEGLLTLFVFAGPDHDTFFGVVYPTQVRRLTGHRAKCISDRFLGVWSVRMQGEIEILRKTIGFKVTLLDTGSALEDPEVSMRR